MKSEFGKGLTYCLGLFLKHADQYDLDKKTYENLSKLNPREKRSKDIFKTCIPAIEGMIDFAEISEWKNKNLSYLYILKKEIEECLQEKPISSNYFIETLPQTWFNAASDHLYKLQIPSNFPDDLKKRLESFQNKVLELGYGFQKDVKEDDVTWAIEECKKLLMKIDKTLGVEVIKGEWE